MNHTVTGEVIVLKELNDASEEDHQKMFMDEIKLLSKLSHTNVLRYDSRFIIYFNTIEIVKSFVGKPLRLCRFFSYRQCVCPLKTFDFICIVQKV